ncbi:hypothetical protein Tco_0484356 [Tanacetum coccineum]
MPGRPRKQRIRAPHEIKFPNRVSRAANRGRPKKNVANVELGGDATINMDESSSQVRQGGAATSINVASVGVEADTNVDPGTNVALVDVESNACNDTVRYASLGDFVSVRCEGTTTATTSRGGLGVRRGRGGKTVGLGVRRVTSEGTTAARIGRGGQTLRGLGRWFELGEKTQNEPNEQPTPVTQQSQARIQQEPQAAERGNRNLRPRSARIMKNKLRRSIDGTGSSNTNALNLD